jgi:VIT1/CCC1 family predicted Fe2+/Mn2+ transporter
MGNFSDSPSWKWRLVVRFFGSMLMILPFLAGMTVWNPAYAVISVLGGMLLVMVS